MRKPLVRAAAIVLIFSMLAAGCDYFIEPTPQVVGPNGETATPTPNETQKAIAVMLTQTRAAPTATSTAVVTATMTPTSTATTPPPGSSERPVVTGERILAGDAALTVLSVEELAEAGTRKAAEGAALLDVEVVIENEAEEALDYTPLYFRLEDAQGSAYQPVPGGAGPALQSGTLRAGEWVRGHVTFEIPAEVSGLRLRFTPLMPGGYAVEAWVDLSQSPVEAELPGTPPVGGLAAGSGGLPVTGQRDESGEIALSISEVKVVERMGSTRAAAGNKLVVMAATIENVSRTRVPFNPDYFSARDAQGYEYPAVIIPIETVLGAGSLRQGEKVSGQVVFEVPGEVTRLVVEYQPQVLVEEYPVIRFLVEVGE